MPTWRFVESSYSTYLASFNTQGTTNERTEEMPTGVIRAAHEATADYDDAPDEVTNEFLVDHEAAKTLHTLERIYFDSMAADEGSRPFSQRVDAFVHDNSDTLQRIRSLWHRQVSGNGIVPLSIQRSPARRSRMRSGQSFDNTVSGLYADRGGFDAHSLSCDGCGLKHFVHAMFKSVIGLLSTGAITSWGDFESYNSRVNPNNCTPSEWSGSFQSTRSLYIRGGTYSVAATGVGLGWLLFWIRASAQALAWTKWVMVYGASSERPYDIVPFDQCTSRTIEFGNDTALALWMMRNTRVCQSCSRTATQSTMRRVLGRYEETITVCSRCYSNLRQCGNCGNRTAYLFGDGYCRNCSNRSTANAVQSWSADPSFDPRDEADYHLGVELEVVAKPNTDRLQCGVAINEFWGNDAICKNDGSLPPGGLEIATCPASLKWHRKKWVEFLKTDVARKRLQSFRYEQTGLHVHLSKSAFTPLSSTKAGIFITSKGMQQWIWGFFARQANNYCRAQDKGMRDGLRHRGERYDVWNVSNTNTYEIRGFKGSLNPRRILAALDFADAMVHYVRLEHLSIAMLCSGDRFTEFIKGNFGRWPYLWNRLQHGDAWVKGKVKGKRLPMKVEAAIEEVG